MDIMFFFRSPKYVLGGFFLLLILVTCDGNTRKPNSNSIQDGKFDIIEFQIFQNPNSSWGYSITINNKPYIMQTTIPSRPGIMGFSNEQAAQKVASLVVHKIKCNQNPPTISEEELITLGISE